MAFAECKFHSKCRMALIKSDLRYIWAHRGLQEIVAKEGGDRRTSDPGYVGPFTADINNPT